ncbi:hypothetical protein [Karaka Okahu purepure emaravirus]|uniref:Uncharacterized protein n=1 Tax=Karaka Okahu purepure emaravirus TaxID=2872811 RepID=A0AAX1PBW2_9VIRU|nr:hypothetical protein QK864_sRNA5gp1 [Karaka Okahu purepure emaravirus]QZN83757.1 hypothetical protein [Karaka Okahu purepure emaravirus]
MPYCLSPINIFSGEPNNSIMNSMISRIEVDCDKGKVRCSDLYGNHFSIEIRGENLKSLEDLYVKLISGIKSYDTNERIRIDVIKKSKLYNFFATWSEPNASSVAFLDSMLNNKYKHITLNYSFQESFVCKLTAIYLIPLIIIKTIFCDIDLPSSYHNLDNYVSVFKKVPEAEVAQVPLSPASQWGMVRTFTNSIKSLGKTSSNKSKDRSTTKTIDDSKSISSSINIPFVGPVSGSYSSGHKEITETKNIELDVDTKSLEVYPDIYPKIN